MEERPARATLVSAADLGDGVATVMAPESRGFAIGSVENGFAAAMSGCHASEIVVGDVVVGQFGHVGELLFADFCVDTVQEQLQLTD